MVMKLNQSKSVSEFKIHALELFEELKESGKGLIITKRGVPIAIVTPISDNSQDEKPTPGVLTGTIVSEKDIVSPLGSKIWAITK